MDNKKVIFYAFLNSENSSRNTTDEQIRNFFINYGYQVPFEVHGFYIDRSDQHQSIRSKRAWLELQEKCKSEHIDLIVVPTYKMISQNSVELIKTVYEFKKECKTDFFFMRESISTEKDTSKTFLQLIAIRSEQEYNEEKESSKMRKRFQEINGCKPECPSAKVIKVDDVLYNKAHEVSWKYGMSVEELIDFFLSFTANPENQTALEWMLEID